MDKSAVTAATVQGDKGDAKAVIASSYEEIKKFVKHVTCQTSRQAFGVCANNPTNKQAVECVQGMGGGSWNMLKGSKPPPVTKVGDPNRPTNANGADNDRRQQQQQHKLRSSDPIAGTAATCPLVIAANKKLIPQPPPPPPLSPPQSTMTTDDLSQCCQAAAEH